MNYIFFAQGSVIILALRHSITKLSLQEILTLTIGPPLLLAWAVIAYLGETVPNPRPATASKVGMVKVVTQGSKLGVQDHMGHINGLRSSAKEIEDYLSPKRTTAGYHKDFRNKVD
ncbi:hypothetical protein E2C01_052997 [Portunus trituberculatus]|uniref:Uncharacterized protein n=1 Tax=Portunus trituberculatus TaxID=210409 RepID=A0A5B7GJ67_PORTR|nr:hypothetical protein [Portunus trituberculatus]